MLDNRGDFDELTRSTCLNTFALSSNGFEPTRVMNVCRALYPIMNFRLLVDHYVISLEASTINDQFKERCIEVKKMLTYLNNQMELTESVNKELVMYVTKIRGLNPAVFEEEFLSQISALPITQKAWQFMTDTSYRFFHALIPNQFSVSKSETPVLTSKQ